MNKGVDSRARFRVPASPAMLAVVAALCLPAITSAPAHAARPARAKQRLVVEQALGLSSFAPQLPDAGRFTFTAPGTAPGGAPGSALGQLSPAQSLSSGFRFTPSGQAENRRALSLGVATRVTTAAVDRSRAAAPVDQFVIPAAYGVNLSLGWQGFALNGGYSHAEPLTPNPLTGRASDQVNLGLSYGGNRWRTTLAGIGW